MKIELLHKLVEYPKNKGFIAEGLYLSNIVEFDY